ncbi:hypothetical protein MNB_SM-4-1247 [hydrothermal vent metagenome]|uniref:Uncharacterized protein n=1 Tax=hydrothermal vent metagenome TaxID=652676 RepID=A0A1W1CM20_9ZZZZ
MNIQKYNIIFTDDIKVQIVKEIIQEVQEKVKELSQIKDSPTNKNKFHFSNLQNIFSTKNT